MTISSYRKDQQAEDEETLVSILEQRDERGGGEFWLADDVVSFPCLAITVSGVLSHAIYFPKKGHPGFRCLNQDGNELPSGGYSTFVWVGCDPDTGEQVPNEFVLPFATSVSIAKEFFRHKSMATSVQWFEL